MATESNSSLAAKVNIKCYRGDTFIRVMRFWSDALKTVPIDITEDTFKLNVVKTNLKTKSNPVLSFTMVDGMEITDDNELTISKTAAQMAVLAGTYTYDLQQTKADGTVITLQVGDFIIEDDRTI